MALYPGARSHGVCATARSPLLLSPRREGGPDGLSEEPPGGLAHCYWGQPAPSALLCGCSAAAKGDLGLDLLNGCVASFLWQLYFIYRQHISPPITLLYASSTNLASSKQQLHTSAHTSVPLSELQCCRCM